MAICQRDTENVCNAGGLSEGEGVVDFYSMILLCMDWVLVSFRYRGLELSTALSLPGPR